MQHADFRCLWVKLLRDLGLNSAKQWVSFSNYAALMTEIYFPWFGSRRAASSHWFPSCAPCFQLLHAHFIYEMNGVLIDFMLTYSDRISTVLVYRK